MSEEFMREENNGGNSGQGEADKYFRLIAENLTDMITLVDITGRRAWLSISFGILAGHGGRIWAENKPGGGTCFYMELPIAEDATENKKVPGAAPQPLKGQRVLIIDDEQCVMDVTVRILRLLNLSPDTARDSETARKK